MKKSTKKNKKGFTLIELLIVVAIIAILAAIAIPQFAAYRIKGYNAAASSDIRNGKTAEEAMAADFQGYGSSNTVAKADNGASGLLVTTSPAYFTFTDIDANTTVRSVSVSLSNGVYVVANVGIVAGSRPANYTIVTKNTAGDRIFAADSNDTILRWSTAKPAGTPLATTDCPASTAGIDITTAGFNAL